MITAKLDPALSAKVIASFRLEEQGRGSRVRAGSALVEVAGRLLAVQDDAFSIVWIDPATRSLEPAALTGDGAPLPKYKKPDFEAAFTAPDGAVLILGSGSTAQRRWIARLSIESGKAEVTDAGALYDAVAEAIGTTPNIEGAAVVGDAVRLLHRGSVRSPFANASVDVPLDALSGAPPRVLGVRRYDLGSVRGIPLTFTDAATLGDGRMLYLAVAEDTPDAIADGPIAGCAVGVLEPEGARYALLTTADGALFAGKVEGIALDPDERSAFLLTDPDTPHEPAELCRAVLEGPF